MMEPAEDWYRCEAADEDSFTSLLGQALLCAGPATIGADLGHRSLLGLGARTCHRRVVLRRRLLAERLQMRALGGEDALHPDCGVRAPASARGRNLAVLIAAIVVDAAEDLARRGAGDV